MENSQLHPETPPMTVAKFKTVDLPMVGGGHEMMWIGDGGARDIDVQILHESAARQHDFDGVTVISGDEIDGVTREGIKALLASAGHSGDVEFIDRSGSKDGMHEVRIIKKEIVSTN